MLNKNSTRYFSNLQEKEVAKKVGGSQTPNSGATKFIKGDVQTENWLIECKTAMSPKSSFSIKKKWLEKNRQEAFAEGKDYNALVFDFGDGGKRYYIVDEATFVAAMNGL